MKKIVLERVRKVERNNYLDECLEVAERAVDRDGEIIERREQSEDAGLKIEEVSFAMEEKADMSIEEIRSKLTEHGGRWIIYNYKLIRDYTNLIKKVSDAF